VSHIPLLQSPCLYSDFQITNIKLKNGGLSHIYIYIKGAGWCSTVTLDLNLGDALFDSPLGQCIPCLRFFMTCLNAFRLMLGYCLHWTITTLIPFQVHYLLVSCHWCNIVRASESIIIVRLPWKYLIHWQDIAIICQSQQKLFYCHQRFYFMICFSQLGHLQLVHTM